MNVQESRAVLLAPHLHKTTLPNGLTVLVKETPGVKAATVQIWVRAGSIYEAQDEGGITHLIEHMIFKGTPNRGPGALAASIESLGGRINAYTAFESTVYHATLSARYWQTALEVLTDAVLHSTFDPDELEREKKVVLEEIRMRNDRPDVKIFEQLMSLAYQTHPYRLPVIGTVESVSSFNRDKIGNYLAKHYHPENFTVVVVGAVEAARVIEQVTALMGGLERGGSAQPDIPQEGAAQEARLSKVEADINQSHMALAFPITPFNHPDSPVLDVIAAILGQGEASRLYHQLRDEKRLVYKINASAFTPRYPGLMEVKAVLETADIMPALENILAELFKLKYLPVADDELARIKHSLESDFVFNLERVEGQARVLGSFEFMSGDPREDDYLLKVRAVSREDIKRVASRYFNGNRLIATLLLPNGSGLDLPAASLQEVIAKAEEAARHGIPASLVPDSYLSNVHQFHLENGIRLLVREDRTVPTVGIRAVFPGGLRSETEMTNGAFNFILEMLPAGTEKMSARQLTLKVADMAGELSGFNGKNTFGIKAEFLSRFFEPGLELVRDVIMTPAFAEDEGEKNRAELLNSLKQQEDSLPAVAFREFNRILFHGHPYGLNTVGAEPVIKKFTVGELERIYREHARPERMVLAVSGDVEAEKVREAVLKLFGGWQVAAEKTSAVTEENFLPPQPPARPELFSLSRDKEQVHIIIGFLGTTLNHPDRFGIEVLDHVLNGQSGRLFQELRDKKSLAYSLSSFSLVGVDTGSFGIYIGTAPEKKDEAIRSVWQEIARVRQENITAEELQKAKNTLIGNYELGLQTHSAQALEIALNEIYGLGQNFGNRYIEEINRVSAEQVREIAGKYLDTNRFVQVTVGSGK